MPVHSRLQEVTISGLISPVNPSNQTCCVIIANTWTAWLYLIGTLRLNCLGVFCDFGLSDWTFHANKHGPLSHSLWHPT
ncbi:MAG: hypothetical protein ACK53Y_15945, partial [bacterium]